METITILKIIILIMSIVIHEVSHGYAALALGDVTAKYAGRLTLNPVKHLDIFGSIVLPLLLLMTGTGFIVGWAKPVPYNPYNLRNQRWGELVVAIAGPLSNICLAVIFGLLVRFAVLLSLPASFVGLALVIVIINLVLAVFNLIPIPPLDGSKVLLSLLPTEQMMKVKAFYERSGLLLIMVVFFVAWNFIWPIVSVLAGLITGFSV